MVAFVPRLGRITYYSEGHVFFQYDLKSVTMFSTRWLWLSPSTFLAIQHS